MPHHLLPALRAPSNLAGLYFAHLLPTLEGFAPPAQSSNRGETTLVFSFSSPSLFVTFATKRITETEKENSLNPWTIQSWLCNKPQAYNDYCFDLQWNMWSFLRAKILDAPLHSSLKYQFMIHPRHKSNNIGRYKVLRQICTKRAGTKLHLASRAQLTWKPALWGYEGVRYMLR